MRVRPIASRFTAIAVAALVLASAQPLCAAGKRTNPRRYLPPTYAAAIELDGVHGRTIRGLKIVADHSIVLDRCSDITIIACDVRSIVLTNCDDIRIVNSFIRNSRHVGVEIERCAGVLVQGNRIEKVSTGVYALQSQGVQVVGNFVQDVRGPLPRGQMVQFDKVTGPDNVIADNYARNRFGRSRVEDVISLYQSAGTPDSPIVVAANYIAGDPRRGSEGMSRSGSGIMLGDGGGAFVHCYDNVLVNPGQVGIGVAGGYLIAVENNVILSHASNVANVGLYLWNQSDSPGGDITVTGNQIAWRDRRGRSNPYWDGGGFWPIEVFDNHFNVANLLDPVPRPPSAAPRPPRPFGKNPQFPWR